MVGDGELRDQVEEMIHKFDLGSSFLITGWVDNPTAYMKVMDVGCLLSRWEGFGLVLPEYMACGLPIIATNVDAIPNIIKDGENGLLVAEDDYGSCASAVQKIFLNCSLQSKLVYFGKIKVKEKYYMEKVDADTMAMYCSVCKE
ncbi:glycosyltransferase [Lactobacillus johnsonii]|uniref:glycosyltransferase n=1 Tax=Lactobacillus johnsonii TaxID=33959 RepID=UPI001F140347|nr:glycosyltransferase [Lactobacillus johnsonii]